MLSTVQKHELKVLLSQIKELGDEWDLHYKYLSNLTDSNLYVSSTSSCTNVDEMFTWSDTPQGHDFWSPLNSAHKEEYGNEIYAYAKKADDAKYMVDHYSLIARVLVLDKEAASYMIKEAPKLEGFKPSNRLRYCFEYNSTPQGCEYWTDIALKLRALPHNALY